MVPGAYRNLVKVVVAVCAAATFISCANKLKNIDADKIAEAPTQVVLNMDAAMTENGVMQMRLSAPRMERYEAPEGPNSREYFPIGFKVLAYNEVGQLETQIVSDEAEHLVTEAGEQWSAFGNVVINNFIKGEKIETDTLYWDREQQLIHTDCYVKISSPQGFMQGYGMISDEKASNARLLRPFDSYGIVSEDSTGTSYIDTVNFIGPNYKR